MIPVISVPSVHIREWISKNSSVVCHNCQNKEKQHGGFNRVRLIIYCITPTVSQTFINSLAPKGMKLLDRQHFMDENVFNVNEVCVNMVGFGKMGY